MKKMILSTLMVVSLSAGAMRTPPLARHNASYKNTIMQVINDAAMGSYRVQNVQNKQDFTWNDKKYKFTEFKDLKSFYYEGCHEEAQEIVCGTSYLVLQHPFDDVAIKVELTSRVRADFNTMVTMNVIPGQWR